MAQESGKNVQRINIPFFEGVNSTVQHVIARKTELAHIENARAPQIGVLEKRQGQEVIGTDTDGGIFETLGNFGLVYWVDGGNESQGLLRVTTINGIVANIYYLNRAFSPGRFDSINISESVIVSKVIFGSLNETLTLTESVTMLLQSFVSVSDAITITEDITLSVF